MKIDQVYRDDHGTTWVYATYERPTYKVMKRRRRHHNRKHRIPLWYKITTLLSALIIFLAVASSISEHREAQPTFNESNIKLISERIPVTKLEQTPPGVTDQVMSTAESEEPVVEEVLEPVEEITEPELELTVEECIGQAEFTIGDASFVSLDLPDVYYPGMDFSSFQPYEDYSCITNRSSAAYSITRSDRAYNDENGLRRYSISDGQFSVEGRDDYVIALGTFYKPKGTCGQRYLVVTSTGYYTAIAGDEKSDLHTDDMHMFTMHGDGTAGIIEWLVDTDTLNTSMRRSGNIATSKGPVEELKGEILYIYLINE